MQQFHVISCHVLWRELCYFGAVSHNSFTFHFLKQGLHDTPDILRAEVQQAIDRVDDDYAAILLGYGLCSNGLVGVHPRHIPLVVMRGHDCITFFLGSKKRYQDYYNRFPGTYWYTPGWIDTTDMPGEKRYHKIKQEYIEKYGAENADYLLEMDQSWIQKYSNAAYVDLGFYDTTHYKQYTQKCADWLGWRCDVVEGDARLIQNFLNGRWNSDDFLIVEPGEEIIAAYDERVITKKQTAIEKDGNEQSRERI